MNFKITVAPKLIPNQSIALLVNKETKLNYLFLTKQELDFAKKKINNSETSISINQYNRYIYIQVIDLKKEAYRITEACRKAGSNIQGFATKSKLQDIQLISELKDNNLLIAFVEGLALSLYRFTKYLKEDKEKQNVLKNITIAEHAISEKLIFELESTIESVFIARDLINEPVNHLNAVQMGQEIENLGKKAGFAVQVFNKKKIESLKMGGLLAVNKGSVDPPTFSILEWKPKNKSNKKPFVIVGKGVVYDTGGLSLKPTNDSMDYMKSDMSGAAAVAGLFNLLARTKLPIHVIGLIPSTDNRPGGNAYAPGDIVTMFDGTTVEMMNSDAEGRMILADALAYAKRYKPELVIDLSTLTGAAAIALGPHAMAGMGNASRDVMSQLIKSGENVFERIVEFPFWEEYDELIKSDIADLKNIGGRYGGSIVGGKFMEHFTDYPYIHLDIAGVAFNKKPDTYRTLGGVGVGIRLIFDFLKNNK